MTMPMPIPAESFRHRLHRECQARGLTLRELGELAGLSHGYIRLVEVGKRQGKAHDYVVRLALALDLDPRELLVHALRDTLLATVGDALGLLVSQDQESPVDRDTSLNRCVDQMLTCGALAEGSTPPL